MTKMLSKNAIDAVVAEANLSTGPVYHSSLEARITRKRGKTGFLYYASDGRRLTNNEEIARLNSLAIPPACFDVIIPTDAQSHLQVVGIDTRDLRARWLTIDNALPTVVWILDNLYIRVGNAGYAETNKSNAFATPRDRQVKIEGATVKSQRDE